MPRLRLAWLKHLALAVIALLLLLCAAEVAVRIHDGPPSYTTSSSDGDFVMPSRLLHHQLRPLQKYAARKTETLATVSFTTNSFGLRGIEPAVPKPPGVYRVLCLGDETILAPEVPEPETFCALLQQQLQSHTRLEVEFVNAGVPGYCPLLSLLQVRRELMSLQPDCLILHLSPEDFAEDRELRRFARLDRLGVPVACGHPDLLHKDAPRHQRWWEQLSLVHAARRSLGMACRENAPQPHWSQSKGLGEEIHQQQTLSSLTQLRNLAQAMRAEFVLAVLPSPADQGNGDFASMLADFAREQQIPLCLAADGQATIGPRGFLKGSRQLSPEGHALYARCLEQFLLQHAAGGWNSPYFRQPATFPAAGHERLRR